MTEDKSRETAAASSEPQTETQAGKSVQKRLTLTLLIVLLMGATAIAAVYRQEIYVGVVRTISNMLTTKPVIKTAVESPKPEPMAPNGPEVTTVAPAAVSQDKPDIRLDQAPAPTLSLADEVTKSMESAPKEGTPGTAGQSASPIESLPVTPPPNQTQSAKAAPPTTDPEPAKPPAEAPKTATDSKQEKNSGQKQAKAQEQTPRKNEVIEAKTPPSSEQFQVPGSLMVKIENYSGSITRWRLMIILDDSDLMAKESKPWGPNRFSSAVGFISKLSSQLTTGSKLAVRDFACVKPPDKAKGAPCLSRMLVDWSDAPYAALKDKLQEAKPGGNVNPCAAAAYSMKKDFLTSDSLSPRLLLITAGGSKCDAKDVLKAAGAIGPAARTHVDVLAVGMNSRKKSAYTNLAKKTGGIFMQIDNPSDIENALKKYAKSLHVTTVDRIEVRGEKVVSSMNSGEDITLAPGVYTVVLPSIKGLAEFKRSVPNVRIKSAEATLMTVKLSKGKATVRIGPK